MRSGESLDAAGVPSSPREEAPIPRCLWRVPGAASGYGTLTFGAAAARAVADSAPRVSRAAKTKESREGNDRRNRPCEFMSDPLQKCFPERLKQGRQERSSDAVQVYRAVLLASYGPIVPCFPASLCEVHHIGEVSPAFVGAPCPPESSTRCDNCCGAGAVLSPECCNLVSQAPGLLGSSVGPVLGLEPFLDQRDFF